MNRKVGTAISTTNPRFFHLVFRLRYHQLTHFPLDFLSEQQSNSSSILSDGSLPDPSPGEYLDIRLLTHAVL